MVQRYDFPEQTIVGNAGTPQADTDLATKAYVNSQVATGGFTYDGGFGNVIIASNTLTNVNSLTGSTTTILLNTANQAQAVTYFTSNPGNVYQFAGSAIQFKVSSAVATASQVTITLATATNFTPAVASASNLQFYQTQLVSDLALGANLNGTVATNPLGSQTLTIAATGGGGGGTLQSLTDVLINEPTFVRVGTFTVDTIDPNNNQIIITINNTGINVGDYLNGTGTAGSSTLKVTFVTIIGSNTNIQFAANPAPYFSVGSPVFRLPTDMDGDNLQWDNTANRWIANRPSFVLPFDITDWTSSNGLLYITNNNVAIQTATITSNTSTLTNPWTFGVASLPGFTSGSEVIGQDASGKTVSGQYLDATAAGGSFAVLENVLPDRIAGGGFALNTSYSLYWRQGIYALANTVQFNGTTLTQGATAVAATADTEIASKIGSAAYYAYRFDILAQNNDFSQTGTPTNYAPTVTITGYSKATGLTFNTAVVINPPSGGWTTPITTGVAFYNQWATAVAGALSTTSGFTFVGSYNNSNDSFTFYTTDTTGITFPSNPSATAWTFSQTAPIGNNVFYWYNQQTGSGNTIIISDFVVNTNASFAFQPPPAAAIKLIDYQWAKNNLLAGTGISVTPNDVNQTVTVINTGTGGSGTTGGLTGSTWVIAQSSPANQGINAYNYVVNSAPSNNVFGAYCLPMSAMTDTYTFGSGRGYIGDTQFITSNATVNANYGNGMRYPTSLPWNRTSILFELEITTLSFTITTTNPVTNFNTFGAWQFRFIVAAPSTVVSNSLNPTNANNPIAFFNSTSDDDTFLWVINPTAFNAVNSSGNTYVITITGGVLRLADNANPIDYTGSNTDYALWMTVKDNNNNTNIVVGTTAVNLNNSSYDMLQYFGLQTTGGGGGTAVSVIDFTGSSAGGVNPAFTDGRLASYTSADYLSVSVNGATLNRSNYSLNGNALTISAPLSPLAAIQVQPSPNASSGGGGTPGGSTNSVQYNSNGTSFAGSPNFVFDGNQTVTIGSNVGNSITLSGSATGSSPTIAATGAVDANIDLLLAPRGTGRVVARNGLALSDAGVNTITLKAPNSIASYALTLPNSAPAVSGQQLISDASGVLNWGLTFRVIAAVSTVNVTPSGVQTVDGVTPTTGQTVLLQNQTNAAQNALWVVGTSGDWGQVSSFANLTVFATQGLVNGKTNWTKTPTSGNEVWINTSNASGNPVGPTNSVQYNTGTGFGGSANLAWNNATNALALSSGTGATASSLTLTTSATQASITGGTAGTNSILDLVAQGTGGSIWLGNASTNNLIVTPSASNIALSTTAGSFTINGSSVTITSAGGLILGTTTQGCPLSAASSSTLSTLTAGAAGQVLTSGGPAKTPYWRSTSGIRSANQSYWVWDRTSTINYASGNNYEIDSADFAVQWNNLGLTFSNQVLTTYTGTTVTTGAINLPQGGIYQITVTFSGNPQSATSTNAPGAYFGFSSQPFNFTNVQDQGVYVVVPFMGSTAQGISSTNSATNILDRRVTALTIGLWVYGTASWQTQAFSANSILIEQIG